MEKKSIHTYTFIQYTRMHISPQVYMCIIAYRNVFVCEDWNLCVCIWMDMYVHVNFCAFVSMSVGLFQDVQDVW